RRAAGHRAIPGGPLLAVPVPRGVRRAMGRGGPPRARGGRAARSGDAPARRRHSDAGRARRRAEHARGGRRSAHVRPAARPGEPGMHVYHYGAYEKTAITELMGVYATREDQVDDLLRREVLVNLHTVVRQGLRAGVPSYSLKEVEALAGFARRADMRTGTDAVLAYERYLDTRDRVLLDGIAAYNDDDCRATLALRDWLVAHRPDGTPWARVAEPAEPDDATAGEREALRQVLVGGSEPGTPRWLAGELLEYHRREARPAWWWFFQRRDHMTVE